MWNAATAAPSGVGQVLLFPYYTVNGGNQTLLSVVNTTQRVKAVRVRFLEGRNSKQALGFNVYLAPFDTWTAAVFAASRAAFFAMISAARGSSSWIISTP